MALGVRSLIAHGRKRIMTIAPLIEQSYGTAMIAGVRAAAAGDFLAQAAMSLVRTPDAPKLQPLDIPPTTAL